MQSCCGHTIAIIVDEILNHWPETLGRNLMTAGAMHAAWLVGKFDLNSWRPNALGAGMPLPDAFPPEDAKTWLPISWLRREPGETLWSWLYNDPCVKDWIGHRGVWQTDRFEHDPNVYPAAAVTSWASRTSTSSTPAPPEEEDPSAQSPFWD